MSSSSDAQVFLNSGLFYDEGSPLATRDLSTGWYIGEQGSSPFEYWSGNIEELMVYNTALDPSQITQDYAYLAQKYGVTAVPEPAIWSMLAIGFGFLEFCCIAAANAPFPA